MKFTQEIKDKWLAALKSGKYTQGYTELVTELADGKKAFCCIGVLADITDGLTNTSMSEGECPYKFLENSIGIKAKENIWKTNDIKYLDETYNNDYSNVIPIIENLRVQT
jgi:hypothetical protein